jgi:hypothetical protein
MLVMKYNVLWGHRQPVHCAHPVHSLVLLSTVGIFYILSLAKSYETTFRKQEKSRKVTLVGQSHLRNPYAAEKVLCSSRETVLLKNFLFKTCLASSILSGLNECEFKWLDNTFKERRQVDLHIIFAAQQPHCDCAYTLGYNDFNNLVLQGR